MNSNSTSNVSIALAAIYGALLVVSLAAGGKLIQVGPLEASATVVVYALTFAMTDVISEVYGKRVAGLYVRGGFIGLMLAAFLFWITVNLEPGANYHDQASYVKVFSLAPRLVLGGFASFLVSQYADIYLFHAIKKYTDGKFLWLRNIGSTIVSQGLDTIVFVFVAFYGVYDNLYGLIFGQYLLKLVIAVFDTPFVYYFVHLLRKHTIQSDNK